MRLLSTVVFVLAVALSGAASAQPRDAISAVVTLVEQKQCDEAYLRVAEVPLPEKPNAESEKAGRMLARAVSNCRAKDPVIAFALSEKALAFAPADPAVQTAHAESLLALQQRGDAAALLDRILKFHPEEARRARMLRGKLAAQESDHELAIRVLKPLEDDEQYGDEAAKLIQDSNQALEREHAGKADLAWAEADAREKARRAEAALKAHEARAESGGGGGQVVTELKGKVSRGGEKIFKTKLKKGQSYVFSSTGECIRAAKKARKRGARMYEDPNRDMYGIDFAVQFGSQTPRRLAVGQQRADRSNVSFVADEDKLTIRVFDRSTADRSIKCTVSDFMVRTP